MLIHLNDQCAEPKADPSNTIMQSDESDDVSLTELLQWCQAYHFGSEGGCVSCIISGLAPAEGTNSKQAPFSVALCYKSFGPTPTAGGVRVASSDGCGRFLQAATKFDCLQWSGNHLVTIW